MKDILWKLSTKQLRPNEWKLLARFWKFSEAHIRAIEHQYTGELSKACFDFLDLFSQ